MLRSPQQRPIRPVSIPTRTVGDMETERLRLLLCALQDAPEKIAEPLATVLAPAVVAAPQLSNIIKTITLYYTSGTSDKMYRLQIERDPKYVETYHVNFAYGRRGKEPKTGTKTKIGVSLTAANNIFETFLDEKKKEGYTENVSGVPYSTVKKS